VRCILYKTVPVYTTNFISTSYRLFISIEYIVRATDTDSTTDKMSVQCLFLVNVQIRYIHVLKYINTYPTINAIKQTYLYTQA